MSLEPKLSIITIAYNAYNDGLEKTIKSINNQKKENVEYVLIDGGSKDKSHEIYEKYKDCFNYFVSEKDNGISDAFNKGVLASKGEYVWFVNAGDYLNDSAVENVLRFIERHTESIIYGDMYWVDEEQVSLLTPSSDYEKNIKYVMPFLHPSTIVKRKLFSDVGYFDLNLKRAMDYDLFLRGYLSSHKAIKIDYPLAYMTAGGVHDNDYLKTLKEVREVSIRNGGSNVFASLALIYTYLNKKSKIFRYVKDNIKRILK